MRMLLNRLFPDLCVLSDKPLSERCDHLTCSHCWAAMPEIIPVCPACQRQTPLPHICPRMPGKGIVLAPYLHDGCIRHLVHRLKYHHDLRAGTTLAALVAHTVPWAYQQDLRPEALCPVPLSYRAHVRRGFNQAAWLAAALGRRLQVPMMARHVTRQHGPRQVTRSRAERLALPASVFRIKRQPVWRHVAIIDDVYTTGATTRALTRALRRAGVARVDVWCATRAQ